jgi:hypothetical protein
MFCEKCGNLLNIEFKCKVCNNPEKKKFTDLHSLWNNRGDKVFITIARRFTDDLFVVFGRFNHKIKGTGYFVKRFSSKDYQKRTMYVKPKNKKYAPFNPITSLGLYPEMQFNAHYWIHVLQERGRDLDYYNIGILQEPYYELDSSDWKVIEQWWSGKDPPPDLFNINLLKLMSKEDLQIIYRFKGFDDIINNKNTLIRKIIGEEGDFKDVELMVDEMIKMLKNIMNDIKNFEKGDVEAGVSIRMVMQNIINQTLKIETKIQKDRDFLEMQKQ